MAERIPDAALVVRGGQTRPEDTQRRIRKALGEYYAEAKSLSANDLLAGLRLAVVKVILGTRDEIILEGNEHYHGLDLNLSVSPILKVETAWLDG